MIRSILLPLALVLCEKGGVPDWFLRYSIHPIDSRHEYACSKYSGNCHTGISGLRPAVARRDHGMVIDRRQVADDFDAQISVAGKVITVRALNEVLAFQFD